MSKPPLHAPYTSAIGPCPTLIQIVGRDMQRKRTITPSIFFTELLCSSEIISMKIVSALQLKNRLRYSHKTWYKCKSSSDDVQKIGTESLPTFITELRSSEIISMKVVSALQPQNRQRYFHETRYNINHYQTLCRE